MNDLISKAKIRAIEVRNKMGLGDEPIPNIFRLLENEGIYLFTRALKDNISAIFMRMNNNHLVVINSNKTVGHQIFSAAHELSHFLFDKDVIGRICEVNKYNQNDEIEKLADFFAAYFLMPDDGVLKYISKRKGANDTELNLEDVIYLQQNFNVSWTAMLYKLLNLNFLSSEQVERYKSIGIISKARQLGYPTDIYEKNKEIINSQKYIENVMTLLKENEISDKKAHEYLSILNKSSEEVKND